LGIELRWISRETPASGTLSTNTAANFGWHGLHSDQQLDLREAASGLLATLQGACCGGDYRANCNACPFLTVRMN
jgi:hypothetical protein